ncbi:alpha/beta hydrolase [Salicibibacter cibi]|uniref:Alpha/beta hydrolase n=1 Tax=Salicibibacter cibi TaxID=2743001 RepID=A0A7T6ZD86_9BACI|nr:alpha/beta hydrolase [Salicibibacter cibi]QQK81117.1 alpha/beta hydrolase [Salicibibacter cibi]
MPYIKLENHTIHYRREGSGPPLILLHGMGNNSRSWADQLQVLRHYYTIIAWDMPGYGYSSDPESEFRSFTKIASVLKKFLDAMELQDVYILGHSMGAAIALELYNLNPNSIKGIILADATRGSAALSSSENYQKMKKRLRAIDTLSPVDLAKQRVKHLLAPNPSRQVQKNAEMIMSEVRPKGYRSAIFSLSNLDQMRLYSLIKVPTLIICGEMDQITPLSESRIIHFHIQESELVTIPETGHLCYQEDPNTFNYQVMVFLRKLEYSHKTVFGLPC